MLSVCKMVAYAPYFAAILLLLGSLVDEVVSLWPMPRGLQTGSTALKLAKGFSIKIDVKNAPSDLVSAAARSKAYIQTDQMQRLVVGRGLSDANAVQRSRELDSLVLSLTPGSAVRSISEEAIAPIGNRREEYVLHVPADGSAATLSANSTLGLLRGLTTFEQLWYDMDGQDTYTVDAPISISDSPAYVCTLVSAV